jgi:hypothetical protein
MAVSVLMAMDFAQMRIVVWIAQHFKTPMSLGGSNLG